MKADIYAELFSRGLIFQTTDDENMHQWLSEKSRTVYAGFDPTADSLHAGSLLPLFTLQRFQQAGHRVIALIGGATGTIGDPSGKSTERSLLDESQLKKNIEGIRRQILFVLDKCGDNPAIVVNNGDWIGRFSYIDFLRSVGKHFPVNVMINKDSIRSRIESETGISYTEFSYMLLQAYDFVHLNREFNCELQIGGSDQWGNITAGIDLARRMDGAQLYGITCPLLTKSDGSKMGKTESGTVWLSAERTSPYQFYQYWINVADADAGKCLRYLTALDQQQMDELDNSREMNPHLRASQKQLAECLTKLIHGDHGLATAKLATEIFFGAEICNVSDVQLEQIFGGVPNGQIAREKLENNKLTLAEAFLVAGLSKSIGDAARVINQGGGYLNNRRIDQFDYCLSSNDRASESVIVLRRGKRSFALLRITP